MAKKKFEGPPVLIIRDSREHPSNGWWWQPDEYFVGTEVRALRTGDYALEGVPELIIERKKSPSELGGNVFDPAFERELERLEEYRLPFLVCEFTLDDLLKYPNNTAIPWRVKKRIRVRGPVILRRLLEFQVKYKTRLIFAGPHGKEIVSGLFKRLMDEKAT